MTLVFQLDRASDELLVITLTGSMTMSPALDQLIEQLYAQLDTNPPRHIVFDMAAVDYLDSTGLGFLVRINRELEKRDGFIRLCGTSERVQALMAMTRTDTLLRVDCDRAESLAALLP